MWVMVIGHRRRDEFRQRPSSQKEAADRPVVHAQVVLFGLPEAGAQSRTGLQHFIEFAGKMLFHNQQTSIVQQPGDIYVIGADSGIISVALPDHPGGHADRRRVNPEFLVIQGTRPVAERLYHGEHNADGANLIHSETRHRGGD